MPEDGTGGHVTNPRQIKHLAAARPAWSARWQETSVTVSDLVRWE